ncbi:hypothetical protein FGRA07_04912 [Fusarium graminearum]|nr:hypothetical protein FGRA07_04912 [Fusarium graminearum]
MSVPCLVENDALADWAASDESLGWVMEDPNPAMDQPPTETPPTEAPASPKPTSWARLQRHLQTAAHLRHEEALAAAWVETAQQVALVEDGGLPAERAMNSAHSSVGDGEALRLPLDAVIPDSDSEGTTPGAGVQTGRRSDLQDRQGWQSTIASSAPAFLVLSHILESLFLMLTLTRMAKVIIEGHRDA